MIFKVFLSKKALLAPILAISLGLTACDGGSDTNNNKANASSTSTGVDATTTYYFVGANGVCKDSAAIIVTVLESVKVPNVFTPNGDGENDTWVLDGIEEYNKAYIKIYNRWGALLYEGRPADNPWDGTKNGTALPVATYYYVLDFGYKDMEPVAGTVTIVK